MGLFSKKKAEEKQELPPLKFPEFPKEPPSYERTIVPSDQGIIKRTITPQGLNIPIRKPLPLKIIEEKESLPQKSEDRYRVTEEVRPSIEERPKRIEERPRRVEDRREYPPQREKTLFVKIDKYKDVMSKLTEVKAKVAEAEKILRKLNELKSEEEGELKLWQEDLNRIKDILITIDRTLFE